MNPPTLRTATPADAAGIEAVLAASYPVLLAPDYPPEILAATLPRMIRANPALLTSGTFHVVEVAGTIVACGGWTPAAPQGALTPGLGHVRHVATHPDHLRRGYAAAILARAAGEARDAGLGRLAAASTLTAAPFYAALGFKPLLRETLEIAPGHPFAVITLMRYLDTPGPGWV